MFQKINDQAGGIFWFLLAMLFALAVAFVSIGCGVSLPIKGDKEPQACYQYRQCLYLIQDSKDKAGCKTLMDECSKVNSFEYCKNKDNLPEGINFQSCWDKLR